MARPDRADEGGRRVSRLIESVSVGIAASRFGVTPATVRNWIDKGYVRALKLPSGVRRIPEAEVQRVLGDMVAELEVEEAATIRLGGVASPEDDSIPAV